VRQHVISEWLLKRFASDTLGGLTLAVFDKTTSATRDVPPSRFLALIDDHSVEVERELGRLEGPAALAVARLLERAEPVAPGLYAIHGDEDHITCDPGLRLAHPEPVEDMVLLTTDRSLAEPPPDDRRAIARYLGLMFTRSPKMERAFEQMSDAARAGFRQMARELAPRMLPQLDAALEEALADARFIGLRTPEQQTDVFAAMDWWLIRAAADERLVLGDSPVGATLQLGHVEDSWRPLLGDETYAVCMPLSASVVLVVATQRLMPVGVEPPEYVSAVNRLSWRWADRYVVGPTPAVLDDVLAGMPAGTTTSSVDVNLSLDRAFARGLLTGWKVIEAESRHHSPPCRPLPMPSRSVASG
jgi:Protein of unknown function (DUF4238)